MKSLLAIFIVSLLVTACGGTDQPATSPTAASASSTQTFETPPTPGKK
jgi:hypothetical protein